MKTFVLSLAVLAFGTPVNSGDIPRRLDEVQDSILRGQYGYAFETLKDFSVPDSYQTRRIVQMTECQMAVGDYQGALDTLQAQVSPESAEWHRAMAGVYAQLGQYETAIEHGVQALKYNEQDCRARYELGQIYESAGRRQDAVNTYKWFEDLFRERFPETAVDAHYAGMGFYRYSVWTRTNLVQRTKYVLQDVLQKSCMVMDLSYWPARLAIADLLFEKYNLPEAFEDYKAVLQQNPSCLGAHLGLARIALENWDFENVENRIKVCLDLNPRCVEAYVLLAALRMTERQYADAQEAAQQALVVNPNDLSALSYVAAAQIMLGRFDDAQATQQKILALNSKPAVMHTILGQQLSAARHFSEAEQHLLEAIEDDPTDPLPRNELAMMYMQWGYEDRARNVLTEALDLDAFNTQTYNTQRLLNDLQSFKHFTTDRFEIHYDAAKDPIIGECFARCMETIDREVCADFEFDLKDKTIIEVFPDHRKFGVRIHGRPWIPTVGASTGRVIAMDAPRREVSGSYDFAGVLRHEFTHTVTLAATNNRITHWFTEGLAVHEEDRPRSWSWKKMLVQRIREASLFTLDDLDWGFIRPRRSDDRMVAYAQSEWIVEYLIEKCGYEAVLDMLRRFRDGQNQHEIIQAVTEKTVAEFDREFQHWAVEQARSWGLSMAPYPNPESLRFLAWFYPGSPKVLAERARAAIKDEQFGQAQQWVEAALQIDEHQADALKIAATLYMRLASMQPSRDRYEEYRNKSVSCYETLAQSHPDDPDGPVFLAQWALDQHDARSAEKWARQLRMLQPGNPTSCRVMAWVYLSNQDDEHALPELLEWARHEEQDADIARQVARIYNKKGEKEAAAQWYRNSLNIDPYHVPTQEQYAKILEDLNDQEEVIRTYRMLTLLEPTKARHFTDLAFAYRRAGQIEQARQTAQQAVQLDAASSAKELLAPSP